MKFTLKELKFQNGSGTHWGPFSFEVEPGDRVGIIGRNGAGKSSLLKFLRGFPYPFSGDFFIDGQVIDPKKGFSLDLFQKMGFMSQTPGKNFLGMTPFEEVCFILGNKSSPQELEIPFCAQSILKNCHLPGREHDPLEFFSGGELQKISLQLLLLSPPDTFFLDEPTGFLDLSSRLEFYPFFFNKIKEMETKPIVFWVTHFMEELLFFDKILMIEGPLVQIWNKGEFFFTFSNLIEQWRRDDFINWHQFASENHLKYSEEFSPWFHPTE